MPGFDQTGPMGAGPVTGCGFGHCGVPSGPLRRSFNAASRQGFGPGWRRRFGMGRQMGFCFGWRMFQSKDNRLNVLTKYQKALEEELEDIKKAQEELQKTI